jgi:NADH-quinone oxidoreductase subunit H
MPQTDATASLYSHLKMESIRLSSLLDARTPVTLPSGILALVIAVICMQAKLGLVPFDMSEAETEITGGAMVEYSGPPLAVFKLTRMIMLFTMPMFLVAVFCHGFGWFGPVDTVTWPGVLAGILKYVGLVVLVVLIRNTTPRVRIDQAVNFFWMNMISYSFVAVAMAFCGW